jgi:hypothetical protein
MDTAAALTQGAQERAPEEAGCQDGDALGKAETQVWGR